MICLADLNQEKQIIAFPFQRFKSLNEKINLKTKVSEIARIRLAFASFGNYVSRRNCALSGHLGFKLVTLHN